MLNSEIDRWFTRSPSAAHVQTVEFRGDTFQVEILDFLDASAGHYTHSFGTQWGKYRHVQIDRFNGTRASYNHLRYFTQGDPEILRGRTILEIGSGAGRFTDYLVDLGSRVLSVDPSAIGFNVALGAPNLIPIRADLFDVPVRREEIDVVFCRGVTQHTADTKRAIQRLFDYVRPGGLVLFDVYHFKWFTPFCAKYWVRPVTRRIPTDKFISIAEKWVPRLLWFKHSVVKPLLPAGRLGTNIANQIIPVADFTEADEHGSGERQIQWSILDTVDMYTPRYDRPMSWNGVMKALRGVGARDIVGDRASFCFRATAAD